MLNVFGRPSKVPLYDASFEQLQQSFDMRQRLTSYVLLTGGSTLVQGFDSRIKCELRMLNPVGTKINVVKAFDA
jgi:actin-related protein